MRAYVDSDDGSSRTLADVTLTDRPADMSLCFRKARATAQTVTDPTSCDTATGTKGAFALTSTDHDPSKHLDVHAFFRTTDALNNDMLAGRVDAVDLPPMLQANLDADGTVQLHALKPGPTPDSPAEAASVGSLGFHVATFDISDAGYAVAPYDVVTKGDPFPAPALNGQHLSATITDKDLEVRGELGPTSPGEPGSSLSSLVLSPFRASRRTASPTTRRTRQPRLLRRPTRALRSRSCSRRAVVVASASRSSSTRAASACGCTTPASTRSRRRSR